MTWSVLHLPVQVRGVLCQIGAGVHTRREVGLMSKPTERALKRKPKAVVLLMWENDTSNPAEPTREYEWFDSSRQETPAEYVTYLTEWVENSKTTHPKVESVFVIVEDTKADPMTLGDITCSPDTEWARERMEQVRKDPSICVEPSKVRKEKEVALNKGAAKKVKAEAKTGVEPQSDAPPIAPKKRVVKRVTGFVS